MSAKDIAKLTKDILHSHSLSGETATGSTHSGMPELIVAGTFILVAQYGICLTDLFEAFLRLLIPGIFIRVILQSQLAIRLFQFLVGGILRYPQNFVIISFFSHLLCSYTMPAALCLNSY